MDVDFLRRSNVYMLANKKKLIGFGAGNIGVQTQYLLDGFINYFVDNEPHKWNTECCGVPVHSPSSLKEIDPENYIIIICAEHYKEIINQVHEINKKFEVYVTPVLKDHTIFDNLLKCSDSLLISAYGVNGGLYILNGQNEKYSLLKKGSFRGLLFCDNSLFVATERGDIHEIISINPCETIIRYKSNEVSQLHGLAYWKNEDIVIASEAQFDRISFISKKDFSLKNQLYLGRTGLEPDLYNGHVNDLFVCGDRLFVSMISFSSMRKNGVYDGCVMEIDLPSQKIVGPIMSNLLFPHSIKIHKKNFYVLESLTGKLFNGKGQIVLQLQGFIRGLFIHDKIAYIGQSRNRMLNEANHYLSSISMDSGVYVSDLSKKIYRFIKLPELCDVYDIIDLNIINHFVE